MNEISKSSECNPHFLEAYNRIAEKEFEATAGGGAKGWRFRGSGLRRTPLAVLSYAQFFAGLSDGY